MANKFIGIALFVFFTCNLVSAQDGGDNSTNDNETKRKVPDGYDECHCTLKQLQDLFHLPLKDAARVLDVCETALKKEARKHEINKWPYRKIRSVDIQIVYYFSKFKEITSSYEKLKHLTYITKLQIIKTVIKENPNVVYQNIMPKSELQSFSKKMSNNLASFKEFASNLEHNNTVEIDLTDLDPGYVRRHLDQFKLEITEWMNKNNITIAQNTQRGIIIQESHNNISDSQNAPSGILIEESNSEVQAGNEILCDKAEEDESVCANLLVDLSSIIEGNTSQADIDDKDNKMEKDPNFKMDLSYILNFAT
ncbi:MAG: RWP-RK domain-containing protein [Myxococcales bacterium]|nr:MAG: RWP-RK domain-containing protein [Myxococcales bacterium]